MPNPIRLRSFTASSLLFTMATAAALLLTGCGGGSSAKTTLSGNTAVTVLLSSTANDRFGYFSLQISSLTLTDSKGNSVKLWPSASGNEYPFEFMHLNGIAEPLTTVSVPQGVYSSASVSVVYSQISCFGVDSNGSIGIFGEVGELPTTSTVNIPSPITIIGSNMGLKLGLQVTQSTNLTSCSSITNGPAPFTLTPNFNLQPVTLAAQPTNTENGLLVGLRGSISSVPSSGSSFEVIGESGSIPWQVTTDSNTRFFGVSGVSKLAAGIPIDMDAAIQPGGDLLATRVAVYDTNPTNLTYETGPTTNNLIHSGVPAIALFQRETLSDVPDSTPYPITTPDNFGFFNPAGATFQISDQLQNLPQLPFHAVFTNTTIVPGQNIMITSHASVLFIYPNPAATTITLLPQTINGKVTYISSDGNFTVYTVSLAAYDLFPRLGTESGQINTVNNPGTVTVYADSSAQQLTSSPIAVGSTARFYGLVFDDNGALRMDCAQIYDGVAE